MLVKNAVSGMLLKLIDLKVIQTETLADAQRARLLLLEPKSGGPVPVAPGAAKPEVAAAAKFDAKSDSKADAKSETSGTLMELKDASGKVLGRLLLGKMLMKQSDNSGDSDIPSGRYVLAGENAGSIAVVADPLKDADPSPAFWLDKDVMRADSVKSVTATGPDGKQRWALSRVKEGDLMSFVGASDKPDPQKGQDTISAFYGVTLIDVVMDSAKAETGLDKPLAVSAQSFSGVTYVIKIGAKAAEDRYYVAVSSSGEPSKVREAAKSESAEDKTKRDKEFEEQYKKLLERRARDKQMEKWAYIVPKTSVAAILRDRAELMPDKKAPTPAKH